MQMKLAIKQTANKTKKKPTNNINKAYQLQTTMGQQTKQNKKKKKPKRSKVEVVSSSMHLDKHEKNQINHI